MYGVRTTSGAYIVQLGNDAVLKLGDGPVGDRIFAQALWLDRHRGDCIMPVLEVVGKNAYVMPRAREWHATDARTIFTGVVDCLTRDVWCHSADDTRTVRQQVVAMTRKLEHLEPMDGPVWDLFDSIEWNDVPRCLTHGDPTFCNTMWLKDRIVLTDPIPADILPDMRALDYGKLLQSCFGFEAIVHGWRYDGEGPNPLWVRDLCVDENEWWATILFGAMHVYRLIPYVNEVYYDEFRRILDEMLRLRSRWDPHRLA